MRFNGGYRGTKNRSTRRLKLCVNIAGNSSSKIAHGGDNKWPLGVAAIHGQILVGISHYVLQHLVIIVAIIILILFYKA